MGALLVICLHPRFEIGLQLLQRPIYFLPERDAIELIQYGFVEALADPVGLGTPGLCARVINVFDGESQFMLSYRSGAPQY